MSLSKDNWWIPKYKPEWDMPRLIAPSQLSLSVFTSVKESSTWALPASEANVTEATSTFSPTEFSALELSHK